MSNNANNTAITPKEFTKSTILHGNKERIREVMLRFFKYRNYYKNEKANIQPQRAFDQVKEAEEVFGIKTEEKHELDTNI